MTLQARASEVRIIASCEALTWRRPIIECERLDTFAWCRAAHISASDAVDGTQPALLKPSIPHRTRLGNSSRAYLADFGVIAPIGRMGHVRKSRQSTRRRKRIAEVARFAAVVRMSLLHRGLKMTMKMLSVMTLVGAFAVAGCASHLNVWDGAGAEVNGVPFRASQVYVKSGERNRHSEGGDCTNVPFVQTVALPTGQQYFVNVDPAELSKTGFSLSFNDNGSLSELSLNTEPAGADTVEAVTSALTSLLPFAGVTAEAPEVSTPNPTGPHPATSQACDVGEANVRFVPLEQWITEHPAPPSH